MNCELSGEFGFGREKGCDAVGRGGLTEVMENLDGKRNSANNSSSNSLGLGNSTSNSNHVDQRPQTVQEPAADAAQTQTVEQTLELGADSACEPGQVRDDKPQVATPTVSRMSTYEQHTAYANCIVSEFLYKRCVVGMQGSDDTDPIEHAKLGQHSVSEDDDDGDDDDDYDGGDHNAHKQEGELESQAQGLTAGMPTCVGMEETGAVEQTVTVKTKRPRIPRVQNTQHVVHRVSQIDLHTKILHLNLCQVEKVWPLRLTKRMAGGWHSPPRWIPKRNSGNSPLPCFRFGRHEDDGPLFTAYKEVLTMELTQLERPLNLQLHQTTSNIYPEAKLSRRILVYFYNHYAQMVNTFLKQNLNSTFYARLLNVPAICIFPYQHDRPGGLTDDVCDYVLCMGGPSRVRSINDGQSGERLSFENPQMKIILLAKPNDPTKPSHECVIDHRGRVISKDKHLQGELHSWNVAHNGTAMAVPTNPDVDTSQPPVPDPMPEIQPQPRLAMFKSPQQTLHQMQDSKLTLATKGLLKTRHVLSGQSTGSEPLAKRLKAAKRMITFQKLVRATRSVALFPSFMDY